MKLAVLSSLLTLGASLAIEKNVVVSKDAPKKQFELNLTWEASAPDGFERMQVLINGQFPGPPLIVDEGDHVEVTVNNYLPFNTTVHYHGIEQVGTSWSDGVPGVSQNLIPPGGRFVSAFNVEQYGTYWYHSHSAGQIMDGLYGPIYVRPQTINNDLLTAITSDSTEQAQIQDAIKSPLLVMLSDWMHFTSEDLRAIALAANIDTVCTDSVLINGKGRVNCQSVDYLNSLVSAAEAPILEGLSYTPKGCIPLQNTFVQPGDSHDFNQVPVSLFDQCNATGATEEVIEVDSSNGWASLNFIGSSSVLAPIVSINNHPLWVYEVDGLYIKPTKVDSLKLSVGGRYSALIKLDNTPGAYPINVASSGINQKIAGYGTLSYKNGNSDVQSTASIDYGGTNTSASVVSLDESVIEPLVPDQPRDNPDQTYILSSGRLQKAWEWSLNGDNSYKLELEAQRPLLWNPEKADDSALVIGTKNNTWVDIIFAMTGQANTLQPPHPLHKHSNRVYVLGSGSGSFNWTSVAEAAQAIPDSFNLINPPIRDTFTTPAAVAGQSWMAIRYHVKNPGAFFLHCHIDPHLTGGMALAILDGIDTWPEIPAQYGPDGQWGNAHGR
ncbi:hypothetical protein N7495_000764 [Penicillium taxi]|uniref:uncharacterized protein n=1 Tax=Penicillium taxi TaxID=168475 RepID=UPI002544D3B1|nr:uncharacterized protein N7495_000764 [Penicillium taxi]KAJ5908082.1 hypothetical protein N7495_000764 [Penicillium taxi]